MGATKPAPESGEEVSPSIAQKTLHDDATESDNDISDTSSKPHQPGILDSNSNDSKHVAQHAGDSLVEPAALSGKVATPSTLRPDPRPSTKRRESEADLDASGGKDQRDIKKRKRATSPPWQFPSVDTTTLKASDGRRISARVNTATPVGSGDEGRPVSSSSSAPPKVKVESPPWKRFEAQGPTSVVVDGKRKSGRVNKELGGTPKRISPRSIKREGGKSTNIVADHSKQIRNKLRQETGTVNSAALAKPHPGTATKTHEEHVRRSSAADHADAIAQLRAQIDALQPTRMSASPEQPKLKHRYKSSTHALRLPGQASSSSVSVHKNNIIAESVKSPGIDRSSPKIKLRLKASRRTVEEPHPNARIPSPVLPPCLTLVQRIEHHELQEMQQPYMENERGPPDLAWFAQRSERQAAEEAAMRKRLLREAEPEGRLTAERLSIYQEAQPQEEPPKQYGHNDHLVAHALHFRALLLREKAQHRALAKKVAHEALELRRALRGPTEADLREEQEKIFRLIYRQVAFDVRAKWDMVANHVQQHRLSVWEAEEELKRQRRLQEKLEWSENMVARQRGEADSAAEDSQDGSSDDEDGDESESQEENLSESDSEASLDDRMQQEGEMSEDDLAAYLAQRKAEPPDKLGSTVDTKNTALTDMLDDGLTIDSEVALSSVATTVELAKPPSTQDHDHQVSSNGTAGQQVARDNTDLDMDGVTNSEEHANWETAAKEVTAVDISDLVPGRRGRRSSAPSQVDEEQLRLSSDESTDMDSSEYDSDEDMSSSDDEDDLEDEDGEGDTSDQKLPSAHVIPKASLLSLFSAEVKAVGLPTPTTSAEEDDRELRIMDLGELSTDPGAAMEDIRSSEDRQDDANHATLTPGAVTDSYETQTSPNPLQASELPTSLDVTSATQSNDEASVLDSDGEHLVPSPTLLRGTLRTYQHAGLDWLASLYRNGTNGILADEMGLGKTIQTIALLAHLAEEHACWEAHLVIVPTSVVLNWVTEFQKFLPGFRVLGYYGSAEERQLKRKGWVNDPHHEVKDKRGYNVVVTSYNVAMQDINALRNVQWHYLVLDEAHNIRNFNSQRWQVLIRLKTRARLLLTGTPLQNSLTELWSLLTFLTAGDDDPQHGDLEEFLSHWKEPVKEIFDRGVQTLSHEAQKVVDQLHVSLRPFLLRRLKSEVEKDLPKKTESVVVCKLSKRQRQLYQDYMGLADTRRNLVQGNAVTAGKVLMSLRRVCNHPDLFDPRPIQTSFAMEASALDPFAVREKLVRRMLGVDLASPSVLRRITGNEALRRNAFQRSKKLSASVKLEKESSELEKTVATHPKPDVSTVAGCQAFLRLRSEQKRLEELKSSIRTSDNNLQSAPIYGSDLTELLTIHNGRPYHRVLKDSRGRIVSRDLRGWLSFGRFPMRFEWDHLSDWALSKTTTLQQSVQSVQTYAERLRDTIVRFVFCTPAVTSSVFDYAVSKRSQDMTRAHTTYPADSDYAHEARTRMAIAFPDSRLLIFDSGKLQRLTRLLRELQSRGSRSLIFTQMTGTLNILEQFLNLLNLPYLRLDGSTPVERRQLYASEFNRPDSKYQCMILSSRAGGVGLNLIGASSVIFYDLDWNPQMDRQCMDRAHRIGQVRDVEVYKMVSEKTVEENILRRANQKSLLDQTVIQDGNFTTDHRRQKQVFAEQIDGESDDVATAIERFLGGGNEKVTNQALESVEDKEDVAAAQQARKEDTQGDADFADRTSSKHASVPPTHGLAEGDNDDDGDIDRKGHVDYYMIRQMKHLLQDVPFVPPAVRKTDRHGRDPGHRAKRKR